MYPGAPVLVKSARNTNNFSLQAGVALPWYELTLLNGWTQTPISGKGKNACIRWGPFGYLYLALDIPTSATDDHCFTLPEEYRPTSLLITNLESAGVSGNAANLPYCRLDPSGTVEVVNYARASGFLHTSIAYWASTLFPIPE